LARSVRRRPSRHRAIGRNTASRTTAASIRSKRGSATSPVGCGVRPPASIPQPGPGRRDVHAGREKKDGGDCRHQRRVAAGQAHHPPYCITFRMGRLVGGRNFFLHSLRCRPPRNFHFG
jgi:hypothetical protein